MKKLLKTLSNILDTVLGNKYIVGAILVGLVVLYLPAYNCGKSTADESLETYKRQLSGELTAAELELQAADHKNGILESKLLSRSELARIADEEREEVSAAFDEFKAKHGLIIKSKDRVIAKLRQEIANGDTSVVVAGPADYCLSEHLSRCTVSYKWQDTYGRFKLTDENIFEPGAMFVSEQIFKVYGEVYEQSDGSLQTRRLVLREVYQLEDGSYAAIPHAQAEIIDSSFQYHNPPEIETEWKFTDIFRLRGIALGGIEIMPNSGDITFGLGLEFISFYRFGLGSYTSINFKNPENIAQNISIQYNPEIFDTELNLGAFVSIGTPFARFFEDYQFSTGLVFYLNH